MAHADYIRAKARQMRIERKLTIDELAERLALPRSTIYYWVRDLPIPGSGPGGGFPPAGQRKGTRAMQRKFRLLREEAYRAGAQEFDRLALDATFRDFVCLYIAEGSKRDRNMVAICNSDPAVVLVADRWIRALGYKQPEYAIQFHVDQDPHELQRFWGALFDVTPDTVRVHRKSNSNQLTGRIWRSKHGVLTVRVGDTLLRSRLQAWMDRLRLDWQ